MPTIRGLPGQIRSLLDLPLFSIGPSPFTLVTLIYLIISLLLLFYLSNKIRTYVVERLLQRRGLDIGVRQAIGTILRYAVVAIGLLVIFQTAGIDLSALTIFAGALGIGLGFGLQNITSNFISGLIILFERPIKVGDRIEVGSVSGDVVNISARATTVITNDNIAIIVPNSEFISKTVTNWSFTSRDVRFNFPVSVSFDSDPETVRAALLEVARDHLGVLKQPQPDVLFDQFGESSLNFNLRVWTREYTTRPGVLRSELYYAISRKFREQGIEVPFPQRDLHIRSGTLTLHPGDGDRRPAQDPSPEGTSAPPG